VKKVLATLGGVLFAGVVLIAAWIVDVGYLKPYSIDLFFNRVFARYLLQSPQLITSLGVLRPLGIHYFDRRLDDLSIPHQNAQADFTEGELRTLRSYNRAALNTSQQLSYDILEAYLDIEATGRPWMLYDFPVNPTAGVQSELPSFLLTQHPLKSVADAEAYVSRLQRVGAALEQLIDGLKAREHAHLLPPKFVVEKSLTQMQGFIATPPDGNPLYVHLRDQLAQQSDMAPRDRDRLLVAAQQALSDTVYPGYQRLIIYFTALNSSDLSNAGAWSQPKGDDYYAWAVKRQTTSDLDPTTIHDIGLKEVARIEVEMDAILRTLGHMDGSIGARMAALRKDPQYLYPETEAGREQMLADYQKYIDEINASLGPYFDVRPQQSVRVKRVPVFKEATAPGAYYELGSLDGSRPGVFYANLRAIREQPRWAMRTLAYHEAIPGHHFQIATAEQLQGVPQFRRVLPFNAFQEGWALYAERLAWELGFEKDPLDNLGRLQAEMFRAVRLVVDTGLHRKRWTREQAIQYMLDKTGMGEAEVTAEIERYLVWPGQALGYKLGMLKILELRDFAKAELGASFDIRQFHDQVIGAGAMPLPVLDARVRAWVAVQKRQYLVSFASPNRE